MSLGGLVWHLKAGMAQAPGNHPATFPRSPKYQELPGKRVETLVWTLGGGHAPIDPMLLPLRNNLGWRSLINADSRQQQIDWGGLSAIIPCDASWTGMAGCPPWPSSILGLPRLLSPYHLSLACRDTTDPLAAQERSIEPRVLTPAGTFGKTLGTQRLQGARSWLQRMAADEPSTPPQADGASSADAGAKGAGPPSKAKPAAAQPAAALRRLELKSIFLALFSGFVGLQAVLIGALRLHGWELVGGVALGAAGGLGLSLLYHLNQKRKAEKASRVSTPYKRKQPGSRRWGTKLAASRPARPPASPSTCPIRRFLPEDGSPCPGPAPLPAPARMLMRRMHHTAAPPHLARSRRPAWAPAPCCPQLAAIAGARGLQEVLHHIPTWLSFRDTEKVEVGAGSGANLTPVLFQW